MIKFISTSFPLNTQEVSKNAKSTLRATLARPDIGFFRMENLKNDLHEVKTLVKRFEARKHFIHIGIGGSALGPQMMLNALAPHANQKQFTFIDNLDPDMAALDLKEVDLTQAVIFVVSKSGGTTETMASFLWVLNQLEKKGISAEKIADYVVFATDPSQGLLRKLAQEKNIAALSIPSNIGGRFSVLTPVGLFPLAFAGQHVDEIEKAHCAFVQWFEQNEGEEWVWKNASQLFALKNEKGITQTIMMPYSSLLKGFSAWFVQLWAESLGKRFDLKNREVFTGLTPIAAFGATDQHAQVQLFREGPKDKFTFFIKVAEFTEQKPLKNSSGISLFEQFNGLTLGQILEAQIQGTIKAFESAKRPFSVIEIAKIDEFHLVQLVLFFETLTVAMGQLLEIDPFNQPGVEDGKKFAQEWLQQNRKK